VAQSKQAENVAMRKMFLVNDGDGNKKKRYLTEKERRMVVAKYLEAGTYTAAANFAGITQKAARQIIENEPDFMKLYQKQREQEAKQLFGFLSAKSKKFIRFCDIYFDVLTDETIIRDLARRDLGKLATVFAINADKFVLINKFFSEGAFSNSEDFGDIRVTIERKTKRVDEGGFDSKEE
jgi:DNA replicative helicase MCM subunit Mcm2 (Cdc46/Mcm family)